MYPIQIVENEKYFMKVIELTTTPFFPVPKTFKGAKVDFSQRKIDLYVNGDLYVSERFETFVDINSHLGVFDELKLCPGIESKGDLLLLEKKYIPCGKLSKGFWRSNRYILIYFLLLLL